jgi:hypothetical protein
MNCYSCDRAAINACKRCARAYCDEHGNATYCAECLHPASALPSFNLYRGALLVMLIGTALAVFLLIRPPGDTGSATVSVGRVTPTVTPQGGAAPTSPPQATATVGADTPPQSEGTPTDEATPEPTEVDDGEAAFREYVVQDGDSLYGIAEVTIAAGDDIAAYVQAIVNLNGWASADEAELVPGDTILLPPLPE